MGERKKGLLYDLDCMVGTIFAVVWVLEMVLFKGGLEYIVVLIHFISKKVFKWDFEELYKNQLLRIRFLFEYKGFSFMQDLLRIGVQVDHRDTEHKNAPAVYIPTHAGFLDMILNSILHCCLVILGPILITMVPGLANNPPVSLLIPE